MTSLTNVDMGLYFSVRNGATVIGEFPLVPPLVAARNCWADEGFTIYEQRGSGRYEDVFEIKYEL